MLNRFESKNKQFKLFDRKFPKKINSVLFSQIFVWNNFYPSVCFLPVKNYCTDHFFLCIEKIFWDIKDFKQFSALKNAKINWENVILKAEKCVFFSNFSNIFCKQFLFS